MVESKTQEERIHCNGCGQRTKHLCVHEHSIEGQDPEEGIPGVWWTTSYTLFECGGCESITLRETFVHSEHDPEHWPCPDPVYYPPRVSRQSPEWLWKLEDDEVAGMLQEVYAALHADSRRLALMGCRAILDRFMEEQVGDLGGFKEKLNELAKKRLISDPDLEMLDAAIEAGSAAAHRGYQPNQKVLDVVVNIVEHLLYSSLLRLEKETVKASTPRRGAKGPK